MKKNLLTAMALCGMLCLTSCSENSDTLSESTAKSLVKKELKRLNRLDGTADLTIGYFECNDSHQRYLYRQLAANDLITYNCEVVKKKDRVKKSRKVKHPGYWYSYTTTEYYYVDVDVNTYFVTIALTDKGKKLVYEEKEIPPTEDEKELRLDMEIDGSKFPESKVSEDEFAEPQQEPETVPVEEDVDSNEEIADSVAVNESAPQPAPAPAPTVKSTKAKSAYEEAKEREHTETVTLKGYEVKVVKARNILKTGDYSATAEIIVEYEDVNPVGRILSNVNEGQRAILDDIKYVFYQDKGWQVK